MADLTSIISLDNGGDIELITALTWTFALFSGIAFAFFGIQQSNLGLFGFGTAFALLPIGAYVATDGRIIRSSGNSGEISASYYVGFLPAVLPFFIELSPLSLLSLPTDAYLSTALGQASPAVQAIVNGIFAPLSENFALLGLGSLFILALVDSGGRFFQGRMQRSILASSIIIGVVFAALHGARSLAFAAVAFTIMAAWGYALYSADTGGLTGVLGRFIPASIMFTIGMHQAINIRNSGGLLNFYSLILQADAPIVYVSYAFIGLQLVMAVFAVSWLYQQAVKRF